MNGCSTDTLKQPGWAVNSDRAVVSQVLKNFPLPRHLPLPPYASVYLHLPLLLHLPLPPHAPVFLQVPLLLHVLEPFGDDLLHVVVLEGVEDGLPFPAIFDQASLAKRLQLV